MTTLTIPNNLRPLSQEDSADLYENFSDIATWANGNVDDTNMASGYKPGVYYGVDRLLYESMVVIEYPGQIGYSTSTEPTPIQQVGGEFFYWYPALYSFTGRTTTLKMEIRISGGFTAPGCSFTFGLYPVTFNATAENIPRCVMGTVVAGSELTFTTPAAGSLTYSFITFAAPTIGQYTIGKTQTGNMATSSQVSVTGRVSVYGA